MTVGKLLGLDHGLKRIGVATCDALQMAAREVAIIERSTRQADFEQINRIATEQGVVGVVIGLPFNPYAQEGEHTQADTVKKWVERYSATTTLPIVLWDEQLTSLDAKEIAIRQKRKPRDPIDDLAARVMLQSYLDALRDGLAPEMTPPEKSS